ncbi:MAG TPA: methyltransferase domain-containing protein [Rubricoccaceae bacterium]|jgi:tocopherol O-methyltransferase
MVTPRSAPAADATGHHYDELDGFYREVWGDHVHHGLFATGRETVAEATDALAVRVVAASGVQRGERAVDIGCGYGGTASVAAFRTGAHVLGLTLSEAQAAEARARPVPEGVPAPEFFVQDWLANGLPDAAFDAAWAVESTTHMHDRPRVFTEAARVLRPGSRLVLCVWMTREHPGPAETRWLLEPICREGRLAGMGSASENRAWLEGAGLVVEREEDWSRAVAQTWTVVARRVARGIATDARYRRFLRDASQRERAFAFTVLRIRAAYATGAMRYGFFVARKPA